MKSLTLAAVVVGAALAMGESALACGDKLVVTGRGGPRRMMAGPAAAILVYADPSGSLPAALEKGNLRRDLERAGHRLRTVTTREELGAALRTGSYDLVFADFKTASSIETEAKEARSKPTVLPTLFNPTPAELLAAERQYACVMSAPAAQKDYLDIVREALKKRTKDSPPPTKK